MLKTLTGLRTDHESFAHVLINIPFTRHAGWMADSCWDKGVAVQDFEIFIALQTSKKSY